MTQNKKRSKLAIAEGFIWESGRYDCFGESGRIICWNLFDKRGKALKRGRPDYFNDLNAIGELRRKLLVTEEQQTNYIIALQEQIPMGTKGTDECIYELVNTTAAQQAEALGRSLNLWNRQ